MIYLIFVYLSANVHTLFAIYKFFADFFCDLVKMHYLCKKYVRTISRKITSSLA